MSTPSPFSTDWHAAQAAHFMHTCRTGNAQARAAAREAMSQAGYSDDEIAKLYIAATMHQDDLPDDFTPDVAVIERLREVQHPNDCTCPHCQK